MKTLLDPNRAGSSGEKLVLYKLTKIFRRQYFFRDSVMLGEKHETVDVYACVDRTRKVSVLPYCFIQVKSTNKRPNIRANSISAIVTKTDMKKLLKIPAPTYIAAVDLTNDKVYIKSANGESLKGMTRMKMIHSLDDPHTLKDLREELIGFWRKNNHKKKLKSKFV
jgi:hypothetical protein